MNPHFARATLRAAALLAAAFAPGAFADEGAVDYAFEPVPGVAAPVAKYTYLFGAPARWTGPLRWRYNPANAPSAYDDADAAAGEIARTLDVWARSCGISHVYEGLTTTPPDRRLAGQPDGENVVGWGELDAGTAGRTHAWYATTPAGRAIVDADIVLSPTFVASRLSIERTAKHEWGHALGLGHSDRAGMLMSGPPATSYNNTTSLSWDDVRGCRCLYGPAAGTQAGYACSVPTSLDVGAVPVGAPASPATLAVTNDGNGPLAIVDRYATGHAVIGGDCAPGSSIPAGGRCTLEIAVTAPAAGPGATQVLLHTSDGPYLVDVRFEGTAAGGAAATLDLVEYFHAGFGHYFVTGIGGEIALLDAGSIAGWQRTGRTIRAWAQPQRGSVAVCRFFSARFAPRSSHFYTASSGECAAVKGNADWQFEGEVFHVALPDGAGTCPSATEPVFRLYNDGMSGAPNHRFTTDAALRATMVGQGWKPEGAGAGVTMCAPL